MKVLLNGKEMLVFSVARFPNVQPGYVQINIGTTMPESGITIPQWWWDSDQKGSIRTSGNKITKL